MTDFKNVASGDYVPASTGLVLSIGALPGGNAKHPIPMRGFAAHLGNFGTGNPVGKAQVQRIEGGTWFDIKNATITDNGSVSFFAYGVAVRWSVPTLTAPGTTTTAPRVVFTAQALNHPRGLHHPVSLVGASAFSNDLGTTSEVLSLPGHGRLNPDTVPGAGTPFKSIAFLTTEGAGTAFIESTYRDGDGSFKIQEGSSLTASGQVAVETYGEEIHVDFTDGAGTTDVWLDVFQVPI
jgi:hypothetical protein